MDVLITNILPQTRITRNEINLTRVIGNGASYERINSTREYYDYYDYDRMNEVTNDFYIDGTESFYVENLQPGDYILRVRGIKGSNAGTGYGRIETLIIGTSKNNKFGSSIADLRIPLQKGFHFNYPINIGSYDDSFVYTHNITNGYDFIDFFSQNKLLYCIPTEISSWGSKLNSYMNNYKANEGRNVVYEFNISKTQDIKIESQSKIFLLDENKTIISYSNGTLTKKLVSGKYYIISEILSETDQITVKGTVPINPDGSEDSHFISLEGLSPVGEGITTSFTYNIRSWTESISSPLFSQSLYYNNSLNNSTPQYNGNISAMEWTVKGDKPRGYIFNYDNLSRLTDANYLENKTSSNKYSTGYTYDKHGNMLKLSRNGESGLLDNLQMTYDGNQLIKASQKEVFNQPLTSNIDKASCAGFSLEDGFSFKATDQNSLSLRADESLCSADAFPQESQYAYNKNGALIKDLGKGIYKIEYNSLNLPQTVYIKNATTEAIIEYTYSAAGVKLRVKKSWNPGTISSGAEVNKALLTKTKQTDYLGNKIYEDGELKTILVDGGYYDCEKEKYFFYLTDHLGNNRVVADEDGNIVETNHYYPFGQTFAESTSQDVQPYKYNGKELDKDFGLNLYDYSARQMEPAIGRFTSMDPLAEKYYNISPYAYVANNPLKYIDPTGMAIDKNSEDEWWRAVVRASMLLLALEQNNTSAKYDEQIAVLKQTLGHMNTMQSSEQIYSLNKISGTVGELRYDKDTGKMVIDYINIGNLYHEITHGGQYEKGQIGYFEDGSGALAVDLWDEVEAYKAEYVFNGSSLGVTSMNQITPKWVSEIRDSNGQIVYGQGGWAKTAHYPIDSNSRAYAIIKAYPHTRDYIIQSLGINSFYTKKLYDPPLKSRFNGIKFK